MYQELIAKKARMAVVGLGYVGLPVALAFAKKIRVLGFDISSEKIRILHEGRDPNHELGPEAFTNTDITFTHQPEELAEARFYIVAVPTPIDESNTPNLRPLLAASETVGRVLKKGDIVVYESTVYPGCTEEDCVPVLEKYSGLKFNEDFKVGYSPERINPGDQVHTLANIIKVVSGSCPESADLVASVYELVVEAGVHRASSIKVAEAAKIIENTQRDLNIALMNELSLIFHRMGINTYEVLEAAGTKWNFLKFTPGLVGGHCIGVDPYYLTYKASKLGHNPNVILSGRSINDSMGRHVAAQTLKQILKLGHDLQPIRVLVMGITFKENVKDIRNSKVVDIIRELQEFNVAVEVVDPIADPHEAYEEYGIALLPHPRRDYHAVVVAVSHQEYAHFEEPDLEELLLRPGLLVDVKGLYRQKIRKLAYWSL
ncbi:MAG: nucleotide sugar dehydrogenase [Microscillaceae bacterium]|nr:nucleotide sugar dehydrogenase [Microscillaceae bacterium]